MAVYGNKFYNLCKKNGIGKTKFNSKFLEFEFLIESYDLIKLRSYTKVTLVENGGLVIGNLHSNGGIHLIQQIDNLDYRYVGEMEGGEYLTKPVHLINSIKEIENINRNYLDKTNLYFHNNNLPNIEKIIDVSRVETPILLLSRHSHFIVNKSSTFLKIKEISDIEGV